MSASDLSSRRPTARPTSRWSARRSAGLGVLGAVGLLAVACSSAGGTPTAGASTQSGSSGAAGPSTAGGTPSTGTTASTGPGGGTPSPTSTAAPPPSTTVPGGPGGGTTYRVGPADTGRTVTIKVGDRLQVALTLAGNRLRGLWTLTGYPRDALRLEIGRGTFGQFLFVATARGGGNITLIRSACGGVTDRPCLDRPEPIEPTRTVAPPGGSALFTVTVRVV